MCCSFKIGLLVDVLPHCQDTNALSFGFFKTCGFGFIAGFVETGNKLFIGYGDSNYRWM